MNISAIFIQRPVLTTLVMVTIIILGSIGYNLMPISLLPNVDYPTIQVSVTLPGADPDTIASSIALPIEKQFSTISGIESMNSSRANGSSQITLQFSLDKDINTAAQDVQAAISSA